MGRKKTKRETLNINSDATTLHARRTGGEPIHP